MGNGLGKDGGQRTTTDDLDNRADGIGFDGNAWRDGLLAAIQINVLSSGKVAAQQHQRLLGQCLGIQYQLTCQARVRLAHHQAQALGKQRLAVDVRQVTAGEGDADVQPVFGQRGLDMVLGHFLDTQVEPRVQAVEARQ
ncbi:hypothetical protein D3C80_1533630 [compost metagenome]